MEVGFHVPSLPGLKRRRKCLVSAVCACTYVAEDTICYTVLRFAITAYSVLTHSIVLIKPSNGSYKWKVQAPVKSVDQKKRLPTDKTITSGNFYCISAYPFPL